MLVYDNDRERLWRDFMVVLLFQLHNSIRTRHYLHCPAIVSPSDSPWQQLYEQADPSSFLHMTGLTRRCFVMLSILRTIVVGEDGRGLYDLRGVSDCFFFILGVP
jgi:hypothetical protein